MIRKNIITKWLSYATIHRNFNKIVIERYGGPDVSEESDEFGTVRNRNEASMRLVAFEEAMLPEEFDVVNGRSLKEIGEWLETAQ